MVRFKYVVSVLATLVLALLFVSYALPTTTPANPNSTPTTEARGATEATTPLNVSFTPDLTLIEDVQPEPAVGKDGEFIFAPTVVRVITVYRDGKPVAQYRKVGDPFTQQWQKLVMNWMFALYYWNNGQHRQTYKDINGNTDSWFDTEYTVYSSQYSNYNPYLTVYISSDDSKATYTSYNLPSDVKTAPLSTSSPTETSSQYIWIIAAQWYNGGSSPYTVKATYITLTYYYSTTRTFLMLADKVSPEITVNPGESIVLTWYIIFPKSPYTSTFIGVLSYFLGRTQAAYGTYIDLGGDYCCLYDYIAETLYLAPITSSGSEPTKITPSQIYVTTDSTGIKVEMIYQYTVSSPVTVTGANIYLYSDGNAGSSNSATYYRLLSFTLSNPLNLNTDDTLVMKLTIVLPNQFTT